MGPGVAAIFASYLIGMFPTALLVGRRSGHDPTREGSRNPGASNIFRVAGRRAGALVLVGDVAKGSIAAAIGLALDGRALGVACGVAAVVGHIAPAVRGFRGGKGVATAGGVSLTLQPIVSLAMIAIWLVVVRLSRKASLGSLVIAVALPIGVALRGRALWEVLAFAGVAAVIIARHHDNIARLLRGEELNRTG